MKKLSDLIIQLGALEGQLPLNYVYLQESTCDTRYVGISRFTRSSKFQTESYMIEGFYKPISRMAPSRTFLKRPI